MFMAFRDVVVAMSAVAVLAGGAAEAKVTRYLTGNAADVSPALFGPALNLGGGGPDVDPAIQWMIDQARGFAFINYTPHHSSIAYPIYVSLACLMIGLMAEFVTRRAVSLSWSAGR